MIRETPDMRRRRRPRDPEILLICTKCKKVKTGRNFSYDSGSNRYMCYCKKCKSIQHGYYEERKSTDPEYVKRRKARHAEDNKRRTVERQESYRLMQTRLSYIVGQLHAAGMMYKTIAAHVGLHPDTITKLAKNAPGTRLHYAKIRRISPILERLYRKLYGTS